MNSWWSRFRRRTFAPSLNVFEDHMNSMTARVDHVAEGIEGLQLLQKKMLAETSQAIREIRWRQDEIHAADNKAAGVRQALESLVGSPPMQQEIRDLLCLIAPKRILNQKKVRTGSAFDGGYVMIDDFENIDHAFSLGISTNDDWDVQMANRGINVSQYDYTIEKPPSLHTHLHFFPLKVAVTGEPNTIDLEEMARDYDTTSRCILKSDIEGSEWDVLDRTPSASIACFSQIVCEYHWFQRLKEPDFFATAKRVFKKIDQTHQAVHVHANNCAPIVNLANLPIPAVLEVTYARRATYEFGPTDEIFPTSLDAPNDHTLPDIFLGALKF